jgi:hypothetical protein
MIVMVSTALLTSGCGGGASAGSGASPSPTSTDAKLIAYAQCMRAHGAPNFPDPSSNGSFNVSSLGGVNYLQSPQVQGAKKSCKSLAPNLGSQPQVIQGPNIAEALKYSRCMRAHGVPNYPDPDKSGDVNIPVSSGINPQSPTFLKAQSDCKAYSGGS